LFEETHWWLTQTTRLAEQWLDSLFGDRRDYTQADFVELYRTTLNINGLQTNDKTQECAVLSRLIYGFSAAFILTGQDRFLAAAEAGVKFQRASFRSYTNNGSCIFWDYGRRRTEWKTEKLVVASEGDDRGSVPMYEQIYALSGMTLYYRITLDKETRDDIAKTLNTFEEFYFDKAKPGDPAFKGLGGWFSHIDSVTRRPDMNPNLENNLKKNWNSVGDHIPAYLINLILAIDPVPLGILPVEIANLLKVSRSILKDATTLILEKFADSDPSVPYVHERFEADWTPDLSYSWQKDRAIIGHNYKIAWNLSRVASYYEQLVDGDVVNNVLLAAKCRKFARELANNMTEVGFDQLRGGCYDAVERNPKNGQKVEFTWMNTKDFWQQEQAILAYLILFGNEGNSEHLDLARRCEAFWNLFFLDRDNIGMYFRVNDNGLPILDSSFGVRGGHSDASGYHCFELNFLAHLYNRLFVAPFNDTERRFCIFFKPDVNSDTQSINILPDFLPAGIVRIKSISIGGFDRDATAIGNFQIPLSKDDLGETIAVVFEVISTAKSRQDEVDLSNGGSSEEEEKEE
jgi:mannose/cellobiose epimerase-like protein (N-acyl-D-glucosamine 2-epimerase family)